MTTKLETLELRDGGARALLAPSRGGMVTRFEVDGRAVLYLDEATLLDEAKNVRGGNPVLFPAPGPSRSMKQHGFARTLPWRVASAGAREAALELEASDVTRSVYPHAFFVRHRHVLSGPRLSIEQRIENRGEEPMPFAFGFHPYFFVPQADKAAARIPSGATRAFDNVAKRDIELRGTIDLRAKEVDLHLYDHGRADAALELPDGRRVVVRAHEAYRRWVIWTLEGRDFVCLEPWTAGAGALDREGEAIVLAPGQGIDLFVSFEVA